MARKGWRAPLAGAVIALFASCGKAQTPSSTSPEAPILPSPIPTPTPLSLSSRCVGTLRPGEYAALACIVEVQEATGPPSTNIRAFADERVFGRSALAGIPMCPACGGPTFDLDLNVPVDITPGVKTFPIWATDAQGRRADTTASIQIVSR